MRNLILGVIALGLSACASYEDTTHSVQLASDIHRVSMKGNAFNKTSDAQDFALLRAAEVAIDNGHNYFSIENATDTTQRSTYVAPSTFNSTTTTTANASVYGNQAYGTANSNTSGTYNQGQSYNFVKPGVDLLIKTYETKPASIESFDAHDIAKYIGPRLNPKRWNTDS